MGLRVVDLLEINDVNQTLTVDMVIRRVWTDPRLASLAGCKLNTSSVWFPELVLRNSGRLFERWPENVKIGKGGEVTYLQRVSGTITSYHPLRDFPFDRQAISIKLFPLEYDDSQVTLTLDKAFTGVFDELNISDWNVEGFDAKIGTFEVQAFSSTRSLFEFTVKASRLRGYYFWKIIIPLSLIVFMSWSVFWIDPAQFGPQIGLSATSMLTLIAFIFATTNMVPKLGHFTLLDWFIGSSTILVFLALLVSLVTSYLVSVDRKVAARRLDRICRIIFPLAFAAYSVAIFLPVI